MSDQPSAAWWGLISGARWFGGKGLSATLTAVTPLPWLTPADAVAGGRWDRIEQLAREACALTA